MISPDTWFALANTGVMAVVAWLVPLGFVPVFIWLERKGSALIQDRIGPQRAEILGFRLAGFLHNFADVIKLLMKEDVIPTKVSRPYFLLAPFIAMSVALLPLAVVPLADPAAIGGHLVHFQVLSIDAGILWALAISSLGVFGIILAGWSSNNKYALLGGLRSSAQMISYELTMGLAVVGVLAAFGSARVETIVSAQGGTVALFGGALHLPAWGIVLQPLGFVLFLIAIFAETNRNPFDLPEGESELVAGFHVEYSSMKFALFFMAEYCNMMVASILISTLYLGGYQLPFVRSETLLAHPRGFLTALLAVTALGLVVVAVPFLRRGPRDRRIYGSGMRSREAVVLGALCLALALGALVAIPVARGAELAPWVVPVAIVLMQVGVLLSKAVFFCWLFVWVRWTLPRFRYDQLMALGWKLLLPLAIVNILVTGWIVAL